MGCKGCGSYSYQLGRCIMGKISPKTVKGGLQAAALMGPSYLCGKSDVTKKVYEKLIAQMEAKKAVPVSVD